MHLLSLSSVPNSHQPPFHTRSTSFLKCPASPFFHGPVDTAKKQCSFQPTGQPPPSSNTDSSPLSCCAVCLGCHPHHTVDYEAACTWDNLLKTFTKRVHKALYSNANLCLCTKWQCNKGCSNHHSLFHLCSGCGATTHGAQTCP
ncbi:hypothetical protein PAXRUDRAFT_163862 [Paxillus rubicundulus Ve08.2h10]|uniref:Uncharacterized protein n=1 Tax=Paxillus rubicundulus Ve08.2h10 TaxID=930991 RepID=A0A0D0D4H5_9AGAM|nr:hypothetical protein PAXRUDRAFT_163862 [Paxillus rubicundulus Ve08.2h10]